VSDLNGLTIVTIYEHFLLSTLTTVDFSLRKGLPDVPVDGKALAAWLCERAYEYEARESGYKSRRIQMHDRKFDWLGPYLFAARNRLVEQFITEKHLEFVVKLEGKEFMVQELLTDKYQQTSD
jgi:hypothetical protein